MKRLSTAFLALHFFLLGSCVSTIGGSTSELVSVAEASGGA